MSWQLAHFFSGWVEAWGLRGADSGRGPFLGYALTFTAKEEGAWGLWSRLWYRPGQLRAIGFQVPFYLLTFASAASPPPC